MKRNEEIRIMKSAIEKYGADGQLSVVIEECSELIQAICKYQRAKANPKTSQRDLDRRIDALVEETADVQIMLDQLAIMSSEWDPAIFRDEFARIREEKLQRLEKRVGKGGK